LITENSAAKENQRVTQQN